jgi:hypothetical protein
MVATGLGLSSWLVDCHVAVVLEHFGFLCFAILVVGRLGVGAFVMAALGRGDDANDAGQRLGGSGLMRVLLRRLGGGCRVLLLWQVLKVSLVWVLEAVAAAVVGAKGLTNSSCRGYWRLLLDVVHLDGL